MFQPTSVQISGPAFSFLLYETCKAEFRQDGFLLGEIITKETVSITDNDQRQIDVSKIIKINSIMPIPAGSKFFPSGRVDEEKLRRFLGFNFDKVVAWYKYKPFSSQYDEFTLKDKAVHKQLRELFNIDHELFSCCFMSMDAKSLATYNYVQCFIRYYNGIYDRISFSIPNLSEPNNNYKNSEPASAVFNQIFSKLNIDIENAKGIVAITEIENAVQTHINETAAELAKKEKYLYDLEEELRNIRESYPHIDVEDVDVEDTSSSPEPKVEAEEDLISFDEDPPEQSQLKKVSYAEKVAQNRGDSPELERKTVPKGRTRKKPQLNDNNEDSQTKVDSNKIIEVEDAKESLTNVTAIPTGKARRGRPKGLPYTKEN